MQLRKVVQYVRLRFVPFLVAGVILVSPLSLCAKAAVWEGSGTLGYTRWGPVDGVAYETSSIVNFPVVGYALTGVKGRTINGNRVHLTNVTWNSPISIYVSGYYRNSDTGTVISEVGDSYDEANYQISFQYDTGTKGYGTIEEVFVFTPQVSGDWVVSDGMSLWAKADASEGRPITNVLLRPIVECGFMAQGGISTQAGQWFWTSVRVIGAENSEELGMLDNVASEIIAGNEILEAMKGDVVALLQQIYAITGDIEIAADRMVDLLNTMLDYVDGIEGQLTDIYGLLSGFFTSITKLLRDQHSELMGSLADFQMMVETRLYEIYAELSGNGTNGEITEGVQNQIQQGNLVQEGLGELQRPDYEDIDTNVGAYVDQFDGGSGESDAALSDFMGTFFQSSMITSMLMISLTFCMVAYVLYGKR